MISGEHMLWNAHLAAGRARANLAAYSDIARVLSRMAREIGVSFAQAGAALSRLGRAGRSARGPYRSHASALED